MLIQASTKERARIEVIGFEKAEMEKQSELDSGCPELGTILIDELLVKKYYENGTF